MSSSDGRRQLLIGAGVLVGLYAVVFGPAVLASVHATGPARGWQAAVASMENDVFVVLVVTVVLRWLPKRAPDVGRRLGLRRRCVPALPGGVLGASFAYVAIARTSGWTGAHLAAALHLDGGAYSGAGRGLGGLMTAGGAAVAAGLTEELTLVALAVAVVDHGWTVLGRRPRWAGVATIGLLLALRWSVHLYYGWDGLFVLFWVPAVYWLYRRVGTVWPLVLGHVGYDLVLATEHAYPGLATSLQRLLWLVALAGAASVTVGVVRRRSSSAAPSSSAMPLELH